ncbi:ABC transporter substrate-binding protein [Kutzneria buriramensis]|uniref:NitT/TauT family transport system substrate-binding protein n=1 Tax=Kutzneria buriramensis TaxID=1045776 RepID=A0A3E0HZU3_9PSEU|nr:ABC transporter substrate-binding protein [Kutzneria buriramensis]REH51983.1 NitT/TauT family transport system substrate-binding protein [Kutzneria buriramensis]
MNLRTPVTLVVAAATVLGLAACRDSRTDTASAGGADHVRIMVGGIDKVIYLPAKLADQLGYFKEQGVTVDLATQQAGVSAENSLISGDVQGVVGFYDHTIDLQTKGKCLESVVQLANIPGEVEMVSPAQAGTIKSAADFKGRKLGVTDLGSSTDFLTQYLGQRQGLHAGTDYTEVKAGAGSTFVASLENGQIDAGMTTDPTVAQLVATGKGKVMLDMRTEEGTTAALGGLYPASSLYMSCDYVNAHKPVVQKLANALVKTLQYIGSHSGAEIAAKMPADYAGSDKSLYEKAISDTKSMFNSDGKMPADGAANVLKVLSQFSPNVKGKQDSVRLTETYTTEFVAKATP